jgi:toxin HigB-1
MRIKNFRHKGLKRLYQEGDPRGLRADLVTKLSVILHAIEQAQRIDQVAKLPGWKLHPLKGDRLGEWSVWVTGNFRLTFRVDGEDVKNIDLEDYHRK